MKDEHDLIPLDAEEVEESESVASNIERYLNNHTREGGHAWQMNMAARPETWHPLELSPEPPSTEDRGQA
jgi:hypothetical protein